MDACHICYNCCLSNHKTVLKLLSYIPSRHHTHLPQPTLNARIHFTDPNQLRQCIILRPLFFLLDPLPALFVAVGEGEYSGASGGLAAGEGTGVEAAVCSRCVMRYVTTTPASTAAVLYAAAHEAASGMYGHTSRVTCTNSHTSHVRTVTRHMYEQSHVTRTNSHTSHVRTVTRHMYEQPHVTCTFEAPLARCKRTVLELPYEPAGT